jgi:mannan endo-1,4-beta-mannosidase
MNIRNVIYSGCFAAAIQSPLIAIPSNLNATIETRMLLQYLIDISGKQVLSGQESMFSDGAFPSSRDKYVNGKTGKYPAIYTSDFGDVNKSNLTDRSKVVSNIQKYAAKGSIIALQYHMIQPDLEDGSGFSAMNIKGSTYTKIPEILKEGSTLNKTFTARLDELAGYFNTLEKAHIAVMWRPFHEMNGDFFWWSFQDKFKDLWIYTWKYLTETKKCNNLLWVFGVNYYADAPATSKQSPSFYYPGHEYVDVLGCDFYTEYGHKYDKRIHDELRTLGGGKPIGISENGTMPDVPTIRKEQSYWSFWSTWWGFEGSDKGNTDALYKKNYDYPAVITQDELPADKLHPSTSVKESIHYTSIPDALQQIQASFVNGKITLSNIPSGSIVEIYAQNGVKIAICKSSTKFFTASGLPPGIYIVKICTGVHSITLRVPANR